jgi:hypothetical protein
LSGWGRSSGLCIVILVWLAVEWLYTHCKNLLLALCGCSSVCAVLLAKGQLGKSKRVAWQLFCGTRAPGLSYDRFHPWLSCTNYDCLIHTSDQHVTNVTPIFHYLIHPTHRLPAGFNNMRGSERADWRRYRAAWGDVLQDAATGLGTQRALQLLMQPLSEMVAPKPFDWRTAELAMYCLR